MNQAKIEKLKRKIKVICTYRSDDGTSGYSLSEEQFEELFSLFEHSLSTYGDELRGEVLDKVFCTCRGRLRNQTQEGYFGFCRICRRVIDDLLLSSFEK